MSNVYHILSALVYLNLKCALEGSAFFYLCGGVMCGKLAEVRQGEAALEQEALDLICQLDIEVNCALIDLELRTSVCLGLIS
jgi:hypothetical protein